MPNINVDVTQILVAIISLIAALVSYRLIPWIKQNTTIEQQTYMRAAVQTAVFAAEQIYGAGHGEEKFDYAVKWLKKQGFDVDKTEIEAAVYELINSLTHKKPEKID